MDKDAKGIDQGEFLTSARLVPVRREGKKVYARTLRLWEEDTGEVVHLETGDQLIIEPGELVVDSRAIDAQSVPGAGGYAPVANTVWTWYHITGVEPGFFLFFFSLARRIDAAHSLWVLAIQERENARGEGAILRRAGYFNSLASTEVAIIALHRGFAMAQSLIDEFCPDLEVPDSVKRIREAVKEMRDAFEHIDERSKAKVGMSGKFDPESLSIFDQPDFIETSVLTYKNHSINFELDVLAALLDCRQLIMTAIDSRAASLADNTAHTSPPQEGA